MKRKRKALTRKKHAPVRTLIDRLTKTIEKRIAFLVQEVEHQHREIARLQEGIIMLVEKHDRHHTWAINVYVENERLRSAMKDHADAAPPA
jgi:hypothetical protein